MEVRNRENYQKMTKSGLLTKKLKVWSTACSASIYEFFNRSCKKDRTGNRLKTRQILRENYYLRANTRSKRGSIKLDFMVGQV